MNCYSLRMVLLLTYCSSALAISKMKILYEKLMHQPSYLSTVRPVTEYSKPILLYMNLSLTQILDVDEKNQIVKFNMWVWQQWNDPNFLWEPTEYENITELRIPSTEIWTPDLVLYNNAGGDWDLASSSTTKVSVGFNGEVHWKPPIIFKSQCEINVEFFPFDTQICSLKLGTWTHNGFLIDLRHTAQKKKDDEEKLYTYDSCISYIDYSIDLSEFVENVEWDLLGIPARRNIKTYQCCREPFIDLSFNITIRRRTLFYGVTLICPCLAISFLTLLVFYLPGESGEKMSLSISILVSLTFFFVVIFEMSPPTSKVVPLIVKYLLFTMILVTLSVIASVVVLSVYWRSCDSYQMSLWVRKVFMSILPKLLFMKKPESTPSANNRAPPRMKNAISKMHNSELLNQTSSSNNEDAISRRHQSRRTAMAGDKSIINELELALDGVRAITKHMQEDDSKTEIRNDWKYVALVLDRLFLWLFSIAAIIGILGIFMQAPSMTDYTRALKKENAPKEINVIRFCKSDLISKEIN